MNYNSKHGTCAMFHELCEIDVPKIITFKVHHALRQMVILYLHFRDEKTDVLRDSSH